PENSRKSAVPTSASIAKATSTSSSEKPSAARDTERRRCSGRIGSLIEDRDAAREPVDVDLELALARGERHAAAGRAAMWVEADRAHGFAQDVVLRGEELELEPARQRVDVRVALDLERPVLEVEHEARVGTRRDRVLTRHPESGRHLARGALELGCRY